MKETLDRQEYVNSLDQLMTISCILAGFAFSGLIALPGIELAIFEKIVQRVGGEFGAIFYFTFYFTFFSTLCFLGTIMSILVYRVRGYLIPLPKLRRLSMVTHVIFSLAIATLMVSVITFALPTLSGLIIGLSTGIGVAFCFIWENMVPWQKRIRERQLKEESKRLLKDKNCPPSPSEGVESQSSSEQENSQGENQTPEGSSS